MANGDKPPGGAVDVVMLKDGSGFLKHIPCRSAEEAQLIYDRVVKAVAEIAADYQRDHH